jgi:DNA-directed RNA polymerase subunit RPC12/RpoP
MMPMATRRNPIDLHVAENEISWHRYVCTSCRKYPLIFIGKDESPKGGKSVYKCSTCGVRQASTASERAQRLDNKSARLIRGTLTGGADDLRTKW